MNLLKEHEVTQELGIARSTLWRWRKQGMPVRKLGCRLVRYEMDKILEWLETEGANN